MSAFLFALTAVLPIVLVIALGYFLRESGLMGEAFSRDLNRLVFRVSLPIMLFQNVYNISETGISDLSYIVYASLMVTGVFLAALPVTLLVTKKNERRGALWQSAFRSNYAFIGIPLAQSLFGADGVAVATLLMAMSIPLFNIYGIISLSVFNAEGKRPSVRSILRNIVTNPMIVGIFAGIAALGVRALFVRFGISFRLTDVTPVYTVITWIANTATPLALLVLGAQFRFTAVAALRREILCGVIMRSVLVPLIGIGAAYLFFSDRFGGAHFASFVALFGTPVACASVPMAQEMNSDAELAGQLVVWTTLMSVITVCIVSTFLRAVGIF